MGPTTSTVQYCTRYARDNMLCMERAKRVLYTRCGVKTNTKATVHSTRTRISKNSEPFGI